MAALLMSRPDAAELPDLVELQLESVGQYFRPPVEAVGLLPLNTYLESRGIREIKTSADPGRPGWNARNLTDGQIYSFVGGRWQPSVPGTRPDAWIDRIVRNRLAPWSKRGVIFGVPHDVHPVTLTYRADLFAEAGVDLERVQLPDGSTRAPTWPEFQAKCLDFQAYWRAHGESGRHAMELFGSSPEALMCLLLQRHINLIDSDDVLHLSDPRVAQTVAFYATLVAGDSAIAGESGAGTGPWANDIAAGLLCAALTPDWRAQSLRDYAPSARGRLRMMPLPRFDASDAPTSTWGGTMIGIPRGAARARRGVAGDRIPVSE